VFLLSIVYRVKENKVKMDFFLLLLFFSIFGFVYFDVKWFSSENISR
jgi:hypothetical protein